MSQKSDKSVKSENLPHAHLPKSVKQKKRGNKSKSFSAEGSVHDFSDVKVNAFKQDRFFQKLLDLATFRLKKQQDEFLARITENQEIDRKELITSIVQYQTAYE